MFGTVAPTPLDLNFSLFGVPVRVHPFFWVVSALMGWNPHNINAMLIWILCVFVSILVHEMGHALSAAYYGWRPHIVLYSFGGYAQYLPTWGHTAARAILVLLAGPGAGFVIYALLYALERLLDHEGVELPPYAFLAFRYLELINLWWGLVNLLPVFPLDGGQISRYALEHFRGRQGVTLSLQISLIAACAAAYGMFRIGQTYAAILFAMLAIENLQTLQTGQYR